MNLFINERTKKNLKVLLEREKRIIQSVLFFGEEGTGKTTSAFYLAKLLLCQRSKKEPCEQCFSCLEFKKNCHPDFLVITPEEGVISIEKIRQLMNFLSLKPKISPLRLVIIDDAERMTQEAQNSLLKILEEPNYDNLIILISSYPEKLLPTVLSRLLLIRFTLAPKKEIKNYLMKEFSLDAQKAEEIANFSQGKIGEAFKILKDDHLKEKVKAQEILKRIIKGNEIEKILILEKEIPDEEINFFLKEWLLVLRERQNKNLNFLEEKTRLFLLKNLLNAYLLINSQNINQKLLLQNIFLKI
ncbi:MAG: DNA polymerase III subunit [Candidatus Paceibacterota bacterium]